jgi:hypothetical protein
MTRLTNGSSHKAPVTRMTRPAMTTPADTAASAAMWRKAPRMLRSPSRPEAKSQAVKPLTAMPIAATAITVPPATGAGSSRRKIASQAIAPTARSRNTALNSAARVDEPLKP